MLGNGHAMEQAPQAAALREPLLPNGYEGGGERRSTSSPPLRADEDQSPSPASASRLRTLTDAHGTPRARRLQNQHEAHPLQERHQRLTALSGLQFMPMGHNPAGERNSFPPRERCAVCDKTLTRGVGARRGTGLCEQCWDSAPKDCVVCKRVLSVKHLQWGSGLCNFCYDHCNKNCKFCEKSLALEQLHWNTGLCDECYDDCAQVCKMCQQFLERGQRRWGSGLCDACYSHAQKTCKVCQKRLEARQLRWGTGLCDGCYDELEKNCKKCRRQIAFGSLRWRSNLCDECYDKSDKICKKCNIRLEVDRLHWGTGLCDSCYDSCEKACKMCRSTINSASLHWGSGLCDECYNTCEKVCKGCQCRLPFGQLHWGSGLCDSCYTECEKTCRMCNAEIQLGSLRWGTQLCDSCFDKCEKTCRGCQSRLDLGSLRWGTGLCDACYDSKPPEFSGFSHGVLAIIWAQLVFYLAPALLQPSLFLQIRLSLEGDPARIFAVVLTTASGAAMVAPVPLGCWAHRRGEREVYVGVTAIASLAAASLSCTSYGSVFAISWAALTFPPAVRGIRATYFAKNVPPKHLSRAAQMATSCGLTGGFVGPLVAAALDRIFGEGSDALGGLTGFEVSGALASATCACCAFALWVLIPTKVPRASPKPAGSSSSSAAAPVRPRTCELCEKELSPEEQNYLLALCDGCYDNYRGTDTNFKRYSKNLLISFCVIASMLEVSMNAGVIATFQPIAVNHFGWSSSAIAAVNFAGAGLSILVSSVLVRLKLQERQQTAAAAGLYFSGVVLFTVPPLSEWRMVLGLMLGIKAQILFMAPFTAIFSRLIGGFRVTNRLTTILCLAPAIGAAAGTLLAPAFTARAGTPLFTLAVLPAFLGVLGIALDWERMDVDQHEGSSH